MTPPIGKSKTLHLSPSSIQAWFENKCPAAWRYSEEWTPKAKDPIAERGIQVHRLLEQGNSGQPIADPMTKNFYLKLKQAVALSDFEIIERESKERFPIGAAAILTRRIDAKVRDVDGALRILDYKTVMGYGWKETPQGVIPQAKTFQAVAYTLPNGTDPDWPEIVTFLTAPSRGSPRFISYRRTEEDTHNFLQAVQLLEYAWANDLFPKIRGKHCLDCPFRAVCYAEPEWRKQYTKRPPRKD